jgi:hypothetical protein
MSQLPVSRRMWEHGPQSPSLLHTSLQAGSVQQQQQQQSPRESGLRRPMHAESVWSLPNLLSLGRAASGPPIAALILGGHYPTAAVAIAISGVSGPMPLVCFE